MARRALAATQGLRLLRLLLRLYGRRGRIAGTGIRGRGAVNVVVPAAIRQFRSAFSSCAVADVADESCAVVAPAAQLMRARVIKIPNQLRPIARRVLSAHLPVGS